ncbi:hypothetical protein [Mangrovihabitans endophyticus]|uniref:Uncharacterized protein n=1 Tax=Mangrovihabitans endophyticus TaxID=1751298 RepID=A0A8J3FR44_9ACTN|nr:hypothetical protein [Mangrovihabitans endophyticus]GGL08566.1 hypothetical protein GCM10012284_48950 [Mangrovihabitans endophyticus]
MQSSTITLVTAVVVGFTVFAVGYFWGIFQKARGTLKVAKVAVPAARSSYYASLWSVLKWGVGALLILTLLIAGTVNDSDAATPPPSPPPSSGPGR